MKYVGYVLKQTAYDDETEVVIGSLGRKNRADWRPSLSGEISIRIPESLTSSFGLSRKIEIEFTPK